MKKPITPAQAAARRANGKLSSGPKTPAGKAASSKNALKFGFFCRDPLLPGESPEEFAEFRANLLTAYQPVGGAEVMLVDRIVETGWRLRRFPAIEAALYAAELLQEQSKRAQRKAEDLLHSDVSLEAEVDSSGTPHAAECHALLAESAELREELNDSRYALGRVFLRDSRAGSHGGADGAFLRLSRCETLLERGFFRCLRELQRMQELRSSSPNSLPPEPKRQNEPTDAPHGGPNGLDGNDLVDRSPSPVPVAQPPAFPDGSTISHRLRRGPCVCRPIGTRTSRLTRHVSTAVLATRAIALTNRRYAGRSKLSMATNSPLRVPR